MRSKAADNAGLVLRDLAEIALESESLDVFRREALSRIAPFVGADYCSLHTVSNEALLSVTLFGADPAPLNAALQTVPAEVTRDEVYRTIECHKALRDTDVLPRSRREGLSFYRYLASMHIKTYAMRAWLTGSGYTFLAIARTGNVDQRRFLARATSALDGFFPVLALGERAHAPNPTSRYCNGGSELAALTPAEARVVALLERGLTNREIGELLGISPNTVRNRVASAFRRVGASRRAELVYLLSKTSG